MDANTWMLSLIQTYSEQPHGQQHASRLCGCQKVAARPNMLFASEVDKGRAFLHALRGILQPPESYKYG